MPRHSVDNVLEEIIRRFRFRRYTQVPKYNRFGYVRETGSDVVVSREKGQDTIIPYNKLRIAIESVRADNDVYDKGPSGLREYGITHINSPIWSLLHLVTLEELTM